jgi:hypothetical protein
VVVASGSEALIDASRDLLRGLQWHHAAVMNESAYLASAPSGMDILFLGWPQSETFRPDLPPEIMASEQEFAVDGKLNDDNSDVLSWSGKWIIPIRLSPTFCPALLPLHETRLDASRTTAVIVISRFETAKTGSRQPGSLTIHLCSDTFIRT